MSASAPTIIDELDQLLETQGRLLFAKQQYNEAEATAYGICLLDFFARHGTDVRAALARTAEACQSAYTTVPVLIGFDNGRQVGELKVLTARLPETPDFVFNIGYQALDYQGSPRDVQSEPYRGPYALRAVSITSDIRYIDYLHQTGVVSTASKIPAKARRDGGEAVALEVFTAYFVRNYPGPNTIICDPKWHAPRIFRAAYHAFVGAAMAEVFLRSTATHRCAMCGNEGVPNDTVGCTRCGWDEMQPIIASPDPSPADEAWISIDDRLPANGDHVEVRARSVLSGGKRSTTWAIGATCVTHWRPFTATLQESPR